MRLTINPLFCRAVWSGSSLARWSDAHPASGLRPGDSLVFVWPQPWGSEHHRMSLKHYGMPDGPGRLEPWAVASLLGEAQDAIAARLRADAEPAVLSSWIATSTAHGYPIEHFRGTQAECEARRAAMDFPGSLAITNELPPAH